MQAVLSFPDLSNEIFSIEVGGFAFALRWYALAYIAGIVVGWRLALRAARSERLWPGNTAPMTADQIDMFLTWAIIGIILGGRLGFVLFYKPEYYIQNPWEILMLWHGGMAFHGGFIGVLLAGLLFTRRHALAQLPVADLVSLAVPPGLLFGRIANFVNAELWGRPSTLPWAVIFPGDAAQSCANVGDLCARHPSQLYEAGLEGLILGALLLWLAWRRDWLKKPGQITGIFIAGYGVSRFIVEYFRQADAQFIAPGNPWGHVIQLGGAGLTMGQLLSLPLIAAGLAILFYARRRG